MSTLDAGGDKGTPPQGFRNVVLTALIRQTESGGFAIEAGNSGVGTLPHGEWRSLDEVTLILQSAGVTEATVVLHECLEH